MVANFNSLQTHPKKTLGLAISAACAGVPAAQAQAVIEEIVVTSTKRAASIQDIPISVQAFTNEDIVRQGFKQLDDYIAQIPALSSARREPYGTNVVMRGCATSGIAFADTATTAVYLDEQPITVAGVNPDPRLVDIERVEALSGPQGTLFGDASQCGTLRILTNKPDTTQFDSWVEGTGSTVQDGGSGYDLSGMVNIPLANNKLALRLVGFYAEEPGYVDNILGDNPSGPLGLNPRGAFNNKAFVGTDINEVTVSGGRANLRWAAGEKWTIDFGGIYQKTEGDGFGDTDLPEDGHAGDTIGEWEQMRFGDEQWEDEWYQFAVTAEGSLGWGDLTLAASFLNRQIGYDADATAYISAWQEFYPAYNIYDFGGSPQSMAFEDSEQDRLSIEARWTTPADSDSRWSGLVGLFYNESDDHTHFSNNIRQLPGSNAEYYLNYSAFYYNTQYFGPDSSVKWWDGVYNTEVEQSALFGEFTVDIVPLFSLTLGGRFFNIKNDRSVANGTLVATTTPFTVQGPEINCAPLANPPHSEVLTEAKCWTGPTNFADADETGFVPKITTAFPVSETKMAYFTYSEGFRRGGGNAARPASIFGRPPLNEYESDLVKNWEIGTKTTWLNDRFQWNMTFYHMVWEDMQIEAEDPTPNIFTLGTVNLTEAEINGLELFMNWVPVDGLSTNFTVGYNDAEVSEDASFGGATIAKGTQLPLAPDWKGTAVVEYSFGQVDWGGATPSVYVAYEYTGESVNSLDGIQSIEVVKPVRTQEAYSVTNFRFAVDGETWTATLFVDNVFNEYAEQYFNDRWIQTRLSVNQPRTFGVTYRKGFGRK
jgi:outer membrane receptor protein involved in Fe transport